MEILLIPLMLGTAQPNATPPPPVNPPAIVRTVPAAEASPLVGGLAKPPSLKNRSHDGLSSTR